LLTNFKSFYKNNIYKMEDNNENNVDEDNVEEEGD
jgi:hypothetical protein